MFYTKYPICQTVELFQEMHVLLSKTGPLSILMFVKIWAGGWGGLSIDKLFGFQSKF